MFNSRILLAVAFITSATFSALANGQEQTQELIDKGAERLQDNRQAQQTIDGSLEQIETLERDFQSELQLLDSLNMYNNMLKRQLDDQDAQITKLNTSINNATQIERQIMPLLVRMMEALDNFVAVDMPFLIDERTARIDTLKALLTRSEFTTSEKTRRVFEAFQIENEYGYTIESYKGRVSLDGNQFAVDFLRIGRVGLLYRDLAGERVGFWNKQTNAWQPLTESQYKRHIFNGLKIAKEEISPTLITLPMLADIEVR